MRRSGAEGSKLPTLRGRTIISAFFENNPTRVNFELAGKRMGADVINFSASGSSAAGRP